MAVYLVTVGYDFVWDDWALVVHNPSIRRLSAFPNWLSLTAEQASLGHFSGNIFRPGVLGSLAFDFAVWGRQPLGFHLTNILLHALVVWLTYKFIRTLSGRTELALAVALLFAVHPSHVEAVAWISARAELWVSIWMLIALTLYHASRQRAGWWAAPPYLGALLSMAVALMFKEAAAVLPPLLLLLEVFAPNVRMPRIGWWRAALRSLPFWVLALGHLIFLSRPLQTYNTQLWNLPVLLARLPGALEILARYIFQLVFPISMEPFYALPRPTSFLSTWPLLGIAVLLGLLGLGAFTWRRLPWAAFGLGWMLICLAPYVDLLAVSPRAMGLADRYLYDASMGFLLLVAALLDSAGLSFDGRGVAGRRRFLSAALGLLVLFYLMAAGWYLPVWTNNIALYSRMTKAFPRAADPHLNLGTSYLVVGERERGIAELQKAIELRPNWVSPYIALADALVTSGNAARAFELLDRVAVAAKSDYFYYVTRGRAHVLANQPSEAIRILTEGVRLFPTSRDLHFFLGTAWEMLCEKRAALTAYNRALSLDPTFAMAREGVQRVRVLQQDPASTPCPAGRPGALRHGT